MVFIAITRQMNASTTPSVRVGFIVSVYAILFCHGID